MNRTKEEVRDTQPRAPIILPVCGGEGGGACLRVPGDLAGLGGAADGDGVDGGGVAVAVAVVLVSAGQGT